MPGENAAANRQSMKMPGEPGGSTKMDYNADGAGQMRMQSTAAVETPALAGGINGPPFSVVSLPVEGGTRDQAGPAGSVPRSTDNSAGGGAKLGPAVRSAPGGDVFPKGSGTVADPQLPSVKPRVLPANALVPFSPDRMPPVQGPTPTDAPSADGYSGRVTKPTPSSGLQPGESAGLLPRKAE